MKIVVVGGAGYIGSHVVRELLDKKHDVTVFDNLSSGRKENLFAEASFVHGDILNYDLLVKTLKRGCDAMVHLAAFKAAGESMLKPEKYSVNNIGGAVNLLNAACETGVKRFVFSSSAAVYGEPQYLPIDEEHPKNPENYYGFTKLNVELLLQWYDKLKNIKHAALRYFNAAGYDALGRIRGLEQNPANLLPIIMEVASGMRDKLQIYGSDYATDDGTCIRDYIHVTDLAVAHVKSLEYIVQNNQSVVLNLGSESGISVKTMVERARAITGRPIPADIVGRRPGDPAKLVASAKKARNMLGWQAQHSSVESLLSTTWEMYRGKAKAQAAGTR